MKPEQKQLFRMICSYAVLVGAALAAAINYELFVLPNSFAPAGVNGICTLIQKVFGINIGYMSILINMPLAVLVYLKVSKTLAVRSSLYILIFSVSLVILEKTDLSFLQYYTENGTSRILGPLTAGIVMGCIYAMLLRVGAFTGGTDFVSALIHAKHPGKSVFFLSFILNSIVAGCSFFVYDYKIEPILLCILYSFASTTIADKAMRSGRSAVRFEIITDKEKELTEDIISRLHHSVTVIPSKGAYTGKSNNTLICIVNKGQEPFLYELIRKYPGTFAVSDPVSEVMGNFKTIDKNGKKAETFLDTGDSKLS